MGAESHDLPPVSWRPRETDGAIESEPEGPEDQSWCKSQSESQGR